MEKLQVEYVPIKELKEYKHNAKEHPEEQVEQIARSISVFGMNDPIAIDEDMTIIEGHGRLMAIKKLKKAGEYDEDSVPVIRLTHLTDQQKKAYILAHNKLTMNTGFDLDILNDELSRITDFDMSDFGFIDEVEEEKKELKEDNYEEPVPVIPKSKPGQIYKLGRHYLMCGDSTKEDDVRKLMNGEKANLFLTDPPYNVAIGNKTKELRKKLGTGIAHDDIEGDGDGKSDAQVGEELWKPAFKNAIDNSADDCACYITMPQGGTHMMMMMMMGEAGWQVKHELIWEKNIASFSMGRLDYDYQHEPILYGWNKSHNFYNNEYSVSLLKDIPENINDLTEEQAKKLLKKLLSAERQTSIFVEERPKANDLHPTMKPIPLFGKLIANSSKENDIVLDLFGGSGTTIIACEQLNRRCYMMEHDPKYVDVIVDRWERFTKRKAELITA